jgi:hypothetical protein
MNTNMISILINQIAAIIPIFVLLYGLQSLIDSKHEGELIAYEREQSMRREAYHQFLQDLKTASTDNLPILDRSPVAVWRKEAAALSMNYSSHQFDGESEWNGATMTVEGNIRPRTVLIRVVNESTKEARG